MGPGKAVVWYLDGLASQESLWIVTPQTLKGSSLLPPFWALSDSCPLSAHASILAFPCSECPERACTPLFGHVSWSFVTFPSSLVVPPSAPLCRIQGSLDVGSDITLTCSSEEGIPRPTYLWEKLDNVPKLPPTATQGAHSVDYPLISKVAAWAFLCLSCPRWHSSLAAITCMVTCLKWRFLECLECFGLVIHQWPFKVSSYFGIELMFPVKEQGSGQTGNRE